MRAREKAITGSQVVDRGQWKMEKDITGGQAMNGQTGEYVTGSTMDMTGVNPRA